MKRTLYTTLFTLGVLLGLSPAVFGQASTTFGSPYSQYVQQLEGQGVSISNIVIQCDTNATPANDPAMGGFDATLANIGLTSGLIMTTGSIEMLTSPAADFGAGTGSNGQPGSPLLNPFGTGTTNDACTITFDFEAICDTVTFDFVFGSEEYTNFTVDDRFGAFISGPGYAPNTNVAIVGTNTYIGVASIGPGSNPGLFNANPTNANGVGMDGYTDVIQAKFAVQPCVTYTIRFVIADAGDFIYDSGILIEPLQCGTPGEVIAGNPNAPTNPEAVEGCVDGFFTFFRSTAITFAQTYKFTISNSSTATPVLDYVAFQADSVVVPVGQDSINLPVIVNNDLLPEGDETLTLIMYEIDCDGDTVVIDSATLTIKDPFEIDAGPDQSGCSGDVITMGGVADPDITYSWGGGTGFQGPANSANPTASFNTPVSSTFNYTLVATDPNGCVDTDTVAVTFVAKPKAAFAMPKDVCVGEPVTIVFTQIQKPGYIYNWDFGVGANVSGSGAGPYLVTWNSSGPKTVTIQVQEGSCFSDIAVKSISVNPIPVALFSATSQVCAFQPALLNFTGNASASATYIWDTGGGSPANPAGVGPHNVSWNNPGTKTVSLQVDDKGCLSNIFTADVTVFPVPSSDFTIPAKVCIDDPIQITYAGGASPGSAFAWQFGSGSTFSGTGIGPYNVSWNSPGVKTVTLQVEENGCISTVTTKTITVLPTPVASIAPVANQCFPGNSFDFVYNGDPGVGSYAWNFGQDGFPATSGLGTPPTVNYQNIGPKKISLVVTKDGCISDTAFAEFEVVPEPSADFVLNSGGLCESECMSLTYTGISLGATQTFSWDFGTGSIPVTSSQDTIDCVTYTSPGSRDITLTVDYRGCVVSQTQQVVINDAPEVTAGPDREFCEGDGGIQLLGSVTGGTPAYFYSWTCTNGNTCGLSSNAVEDPFANPFAAMTTDSIKYYFQVTDVNGCSSNLDSVWVSVKAKPRMDAGPDVSICTDGPGAFLNGSVANDNAAPFPIAYQWSPAKGLSNANIANPFARPDTTTIYTLIGSSTNGCASDVNTLDTLSTVTVTVLPKPMAEAGPDTALCVGESITLTGFASDAGPSYTYQWTPANPGTINDPTLPTPLVTPDFTTTFFLVVTSNGCDSDADSVTVMVDTKPTISPGGDETICYQDSVRLNGAAAGDPNANNYTYQWTPSIGLSADNVGKPLASPDVTTTYMVTANSNFGCGSDAASITVTVEPTPIVEAMTRDTVLCEGDTISLSAVHTFVTPAGSPVTYLWTASNSGGQILGSPALPNVSALPGQSTLFTVTASIAGDCPTTDQVLVTVSPKVEAEIAADTTRICAGDATGLIATGGLGNATFAWTPTAGVDNPFSASTTVNPDVSTRYQILIQEGACSDTASVEIVVNPTPQAEYFSTQSAGCPGLSVSFFENTENAVAYLWDFGDGSPISNEPNPTHTFGEAGSYVVTLTTTGIGGCETSSSAITVEVSDQSFANFVASPSSDSVLALPGAMVQFTDSSASAASWLWDFGDGTISTDQNPMHQYETAGDYMVTLRVTDENGCVSTVSDGPFAVFAPDLLVPNVFTPNGDGINDAFAVRYTGSEEFYLEVFDRWGRKFFAAEAPDENWPGLDANGNSAPEGVYFYSLQIGESSYQGNVSLFR